MTSSRRAGFFGSRQAGFFIRASKFVADEVEACVRHTQAPFRVKPPTRWFDGLPELADVVLLPGLYEHWSFLWPLGEALNAKGHRVRVIQGMGLNTKSVEYNAARVAAALQRSQLPSAGRVLVAHSKGGLIGKEIMLSQQLSEPGVHTGTHAETELGADNPLGIIGMVTICTPFAGSSLTRFFPLDKRIKELRPGGPLISRLADSSSVDHRIVAIAGSFDPHVPDGASLTGAQNINISAWGHTHILGTVEGAAAVIAGVASLAAV